MEKSLMWCTCAFNTLRSVQKNAVGPGCVQFGNLYLVCTVVGVWFGGATERRGGGATAEQKHSNLQDAIILVAGIEAQKRKKNANIGDASHRQVVFRLLSFLRLIHIPSIQIPTPNNTPLHSSSISHVKYIQISPNQSYLDFVKEWMESIYLSWVILVWGRSS